VQVLAERDASPILVRQGNILGATFHPELSGNPAIHRYFIDL
jgi:5'-phosphate synthase pdxT subunit